MKCYYINPTQDPDLYGGYVPSLVKKGEAGHQPFTGDGSPMAEPWVWGDTLEKAQETCDRMNKKRFNLTPAESWGIVESSMRISKIR